MRCINKKIEFPAVRLRSRACLSAKSFAALSDRLRNYRWIFVLAGISLTLLSGCGQQHYELEQPFDSYGEAAAGETHYFADEFCVGEDTDLNLAGINSEYAQAVAAFDLNGKRVICSKNLYDRIYPASTTKLLTACLALKYGKLEDMLTVSEQAAHPSADSSVCGLQTGDQLTLEQALYGLLLKSGNDAAIAIAEYISGDTGSFAELMNEEAKRLGATASHFVNPHGLHDDEHYTTAYDLYLIFTAALQYDELVKIISTPAYHTAYKNANGQTVNADWESTDQFLTGRVSAPEGVRVIGGKTGTTNAAGNCLVLYSIKDESLDCITITMKADSREHLYLLMGELMQRF